MTLPVTALKRLPARGTEQDEEEEFLDGPQRVWVLFGGDGAERQESLANGRAAWLALAGPGGGAAEAFVLEPAQHSGRREPERRRTLLRKRNELLVSLAVVVSVRVRAHLTGHSPSCTAKGRMSFPAEVRSHLYVASTFLDKKCLRLNFRLFVQSIGDKEDKLPPELQLQSIRCDSTLPTCTQQCVV